MASLREAVKQQQEELRDGIAWVAFWREGRSWNSESFHLEMGETLYSEDKMQLAEIQATDPKAVVVNGYYSGYLGEEMSVEDYELMHRLMEQDNERSERVNEVFSI